MDAALPSTARLRGKRLTLDPLAVEAAAEMVDVLAAPDLYAHTGASPPSLSDLTRRYDRQVAGPEATDEAWCNWIIRGDHGRALGYVQATIRRSGSEVAADIAWVVRPEEQGRGVATQAAGLVIQHLLAHGVGRIGATIADANAASTAVARHLGMQRTMVEQDGEQLWLLDDR
jgi:RimJ/RimL family protein N-acetyltransferase